MKGNKMLLNAFNNTVLYLKNHSSIVLAFTGAIGVGATSVMTAKATIKAIELKNEAECEKKRELTKAESIKINIISYIPPVMAGACTIACIFGSTVLNKNQQSALMSAYALVDTFFKEYKSKLKELYGEEAHYNIINSIMIEEAKDIYPYAQGIFGDISLVPYDYSGEVRLFYEPFSRRYFKTTMEQVINAEYHLNRNFVLRGYTVLNELYEFLGLEETKYGSILGWAIEDEMYWVDFNHRKVDLEDGIECYILETPFEPSADWREYEYF